MGTFIMKVGDTLPILAMVLLDGAGHPIDLTLAASVDLHLAWSRTPDTVVLNTAGVILPAEEGPESFPCVVAYDWPGPQVLDPGIYCGEWELHWANGDIETFPNTGYFYLKITPELA